MNKKKVVIFGGEGIVGSMLVSGLKDQYSLIYPKKEAADARKISDVMSAVEENTDCIIHLAWEPGEIYTDGKFDADNILMTLNILAAAVAKKVPRVILASSIHANEYRSSAGPVAIGQIDQPTSIYGATKLYIEALGRYYARYRGLEVVVIRLGGVNRNNSPINANEIDYEKIFLSHEDLLSFVKKTVAVAKIPEGFAIFYAVSDNPGKIHDSTMPF